jgi:hypothetical protein
MFYFRNQIFKKLSSTLFNNSTGGLSPKMIFMTKDISKSSEDEMNGRLDDGSKVQELRSIG